VKKGSLDRNQIQASYDRIQTLKQAVAGRAIRCSAGEVRETKTTRETSERFLAPDDTRDALRKMGGLLFGIGMLMLAFRKNDDYSNFVGLLIYVIPGRSSTTRASSPAI
jgi:uncharacterized protein YoaH (UPF0181 family)